MLCAPQILFIVGDPALPKRLCRLGEAHGYALRVASGEAAARDVLDAEAPLFDLLIADLDGARLPENLSAARFARWLRPDLPVIVLTCRAGVAAQVDRLGVTEILKPIEPKMLLRHVELALLRSR